MTEKKRYYSLFPKTLAGCIEPLTRPLLKANGLGGSRILTEWHSIVGPSLARHSVPEKLSFPKGKKTGGTLVISAENGFATELQYMQPVIMERLAGYFGYQAISRIVISHTWLPATQKPTSEPAKIQKPARPSGISPAASELDDVTDPELQNALRSFAQTLSE